MAAPVISPSTSLNIYQRGAYFAIKLGATGSPTSWAVVCFDSSGLVAALADLGLTFDTTHGILKGAFKYAGFYNFTFTATNGDGTSAAKDVPVGIEDTGFVVDATSGIEVDVETKQVTRTLGAAGAAAAAGDPVLYGKHGCQELITVTFKKQGVPITPNMIELMVGLKEMEPDGIIDVTDGTFFATGSGFRVLLDLDDDRIKAALSNYESDAATTFLAKCEVRWKHYEQVSEGEDPIPLTSRSRNFGYQLERDLIQNA